MRFPADATALDVAGGTGHLALALAPRVKQVVCVDLTGQMLLEGRRTAANRQIENVVFMRAAAEQLPFPNGGFDVITCRFAVHHFADPEVQLREMLRVLSVAGTVTIIDLVAPAEHEER
jgi:ubiquinone/menaquinone biosynthesis C-methylase UbiE